MTKLWSEIHGKFEVQLDSELFSTKTEESNVREG